MATSWARNKINLKITKGIKDIATRGPRSKIHLKVPNSFIMATKEIRNNIDFITSNFTQKNRKNGALVSIELFQNFRGWEMTGLQHESLIVLIVITDKPNGKKEGERARETNFPLQGVRKRQK